MSGSRGWVQPDNKWVSDAYSDTKILDEPYGNHMKGPAIGIGMSMGNYSQNKFG